MKKYILALDQGTTSSRAIVFDHAWKTCIGGPERIHPDISKSGLGGA